RRHRRAPESANRLGAGESRIAAEGAVREARRRATVRSLDHRLARFGAATHHDRGDLLLPGGQQVHARRDRRKGIADPAHHQGSRRCARPVDVLADPPRHDRQYPSRLWHFARLSRSPFVATQAAAGNPAGQRALRASVQADVAVPTGAYQTADTVLGSLRAATAPLESLRRAVTRSLPRLTWQRLLWTCAFCAA